MDRTHFRFFDWETARELVEGAGFSVTRRIADGYLPLPLIRRLLGRLVAPLDRAASRLLPGLFSNQFILLARPGRS